MSFEVGISYYDRFNGTDTLIKNEPNATIIKNITSLSDITHSQHIFVGWVDMNGNYYSPGQIVSQQDAMKIAINLYAVWEEARTEIAVEIKEYGRTIEYHNILLGEEVFIPIPTNSTPGDLFVKWVLEEEPSVTIRSGSMFLPHLSKSTFVAVRASGHMNYNDNGEHKDGYTWINNKGNWVLGIPWVKKNGEWKHSL